jgi:hypothetical protein
VQQDGHMSVDPDNFRFYQVLVVPYTPNTDASGQVKVSTGLQVCMLCVYSHLLNV